MELTTLETQLRDKNQDIFGIYQIIKNGMSIILKKYELKKDLNPWESIVDYTIRCTGINIVRMFS